MIIAMLKGIVAIALGYVITGLVCWAGVVLGIVQRSLGLLGIRRQYQIPLYKFWAWVMHEMCVARILGAEVVIHGTVRPAAADEIVVIIGNHPSTVTVGSFAWLVMNRVAERVLAVAKQQHLKTPLGWCMAALGSAIFVDRSDGRQSQVAIASGLKQEIATPCAIILYPDMGRPSQHVIEEDIAKFRAKVPGVEQWLTETRCPRSGGLYNAMAALAGRKVRALLVVSAMSPRDWTWGEICAPAKRVLRYELSEVRLPDTRQELESQLNAEFERINALIRHWRAMN